MNFLYKTVCLLILFFTCSHLQAQQIKPLKIGDTVPDILLQKMLNHTSSSGRLSDFKGKAIIIDQWFISCAPCVSSMPKMFGLQKQFFKDLQVLPVTFEKKRDVEEFWRNNVIVQGINLTQVVEDTLIRAYFPAVSFPQQVWISKSRKVVAITDGNTTTVDNINKLITGEQLSLAIKQDEMDPAIRQSEQPIVTTRFNENKSKVLFFSYFSSYRKDLSGIQRVIVDSVAKLVRATSSNTPLFSMYDFAYANASWEPRNLSSRFVRKDTKPVIGLPKEFDSTALYSYELIYPAVTSKDFGKYMIRDLDRFFGLKSHEELSDVECYVISPNGKGTKYAEKYQPERKRYYTISPRQAKVIIANDSYKWLLEAALNDYTDKLLLFELGTVKRINFEVKWQFDNLEAMNKDLEKFDLKIEKTIRKQKVIILEDQ